MLYVLFLFQLGDDSKPFQQNGNLISINTYQSEGTDYGDQSEKVVQVSGNSTPVQDEEEETEDQSNVTALEKEGANFDEDHPTLEEETDRGVASSLNDASSILDTEGKDYHDNAISIKSDAISESVDQRHDDELSHSPIHNRTLKDELSLDVSVANDANLNSDTPQLNSSLSDPKSGLSLLDCDDILNFDFEDLNDLDSFIDKHVNVKEAKNETKAKDSDVKLKDVTSKEKTKVERKRPASPIKESKDTKVAKTEEDNTPKQDVKPEEACKKLEAAKREATFVKEKELKKPTSAITHEVITYSAPSSPISHSEVRRANDSKQETSPQPKILTRKQLSRKEMEKFNELNRELDEFKSSSKTSKDRKRLRRKRTKSVEQVDSDHERKSKKSRRSKNTHKYEKRSRGHEKKQKRKKQRKSSSSSDLSDDSLSDYEDYQDISEEDETLTSSSEVSSGERESKRIAKSSRKRKEEHKVKKKSSKKLKEVKHEMKPKPAPVAKARNFRIELQRDSDIEVDSEEQTAVISDPFNDFESYADELEDLSDSDPYAHLKLSKVADNVSSNDATPKFRESVEDDDIDFDEDDDIFKIAPIESNLSEPEAGGEKKKRSLLEELKKKHRAQITYSDEDVMNENEEIESLIRAPRFTLEKTTATTSDINSFLGRRVLIGDKEMKEDKKVKKGTVKAYKREVKQSESDPEKSSSRFSLSSRGVKDRLTLKLAGSQRSFASSCEPFCGQQRSSVHSRLGEKPRGSNNNSNNSSNNTALSRFL